jgi:hypothetical protein
MTYSFGLTVDSIRDHLTLWLLLVTDGFAALILSICAIRLYYQENRLPRLLHWLAGTVPDEDV